MSGYHATTVTRCDSRADFGVCPCCGYSAAGEPFGACPCHGYREREQQITLHNRPVCLVVNDRKFPVRTIFFSHTKPASSNNPRSYTIVSAPAEQAEYLSVKWNSCELLNLGCLPLPNPQILSNLKTWRSSIQQRERLDRVLSCATIESRWLLKGPQVSWNAEVSVKVTDPLRWVTWIDTCSDPFLKLQDMNIQKLSS